MVAQHCEYTMVFICNGIKFHGIHSGIYTTGLYTLFIYFLFLAVLGLRFVRGLSLAAASGGHSSSQCGDRSSLRCAGLSPSRPPPRRGAQAPDAQAQQPWLTGPAAPRHVGSSQTRARTRVPCISRQTPNHCATREAPIYFKMVSYMYMNLVPIKKKKECSKSQI